MNANYRMVIKQVQEEAKRNGHKITHIEGVKESPYKVAAVIRFKQNDEIYKTFKFIADYNRFGAHIEYCQAKFLEDPRNLTGNYQGLIIMSKKDNVSFEYMCTQVLNFICYLPEVHKCYQKLRNQSLGFFFEIDAEVGSNSLFWGGTRKQLEIHFRNILEE